jgi:hypothetical protein
VKFFHRDQYYPLPLPTALPIGSLSIFKNSQNPRGMALNWRFSRRWHIYCATNMASEQLNGRPSR